MMTAENDLVLKLIAALKVGAEMRKAQRAIWSKTRKSKSEMVAEANKLEVAFDLRLSALKDEGVDLEGE